MELKSHARTTATDGQKPTSRLVAGPTSKQPDRASALVLRGENTSTRFAGSARPNRRASLRSCTWPRGTLRAYLSTRGFFPHIAKYRLFTQIEIALYAPT
jgi:hypothetical protein